MSLFGRDTERKDLDTLLFDPQDRTGVLIEGETGIGKSALVGEMVAAATGAAVRVLRTAGTEAEQHFGYAGLHRLLYPLRAGFAQLPVRQYDALAAAFGLSDTEGEPSVHLVGLAALTLLSDTAAEQTLLVVAEDVHWLDPASAEVLAFLARRVHAEPITVLATLREGAASPLTDAGLTPMRLTALSTAHAAALLRVAAPELAAPVRERILAEADGNPLALTELATRVAGLDELPATLPMTERLRRAFAARAQALPAATATALLVAALDDGGDRSEIHAATGLLLGGEPAPGLLDPAVEARLIDSGSGTVAFRHPLIRSALIASATAEERGRAHRALAEILRDAPDRRAWQRAAGVAGLDEEVAGELEEVAGRARHRGAAAAALERAAVVGATARRADRLLRAAELSVDSGRRDTAERLVRTARALDLTPGQDVTAHRLLSGFEDGVREDPARIGELAALAARVAAGGHDDAALRILWGAAMRCFWSEPGPEVRSTLLAVTRDLPVAADDPRRVAITAYVAPVECGTAVLGQLRELVADTGRDPEVDRFLGSAALQVGAFDLAARFAAAAAPGLRAAGQLGLLPRALAVQAWCLTRLGDVSTAEPVAAEAAALAAETGQPFMGGLAVAVQAEIAALRGDCPRAAALAADAERIGLASGARPVLATVALARGLVALGEGRADDAYTDLARMHDPGDPAHTPALRAYFLADLADAAVRSGRGDALRDLLDALAPAAARTDSPALHIGLRYARALLATETAADRFAEMLTADLTGWPAERARAQLAYGEWLRRQRRMVDSRAPLRAARETFDALGFTAWSERARLELRGAGEASPERGRATGEQLTPHELAIARLAAQGLTNREIGQRLYLSHRTVSTHLHRIFPKLGVSARTELAAVLPTAPDTAG
ncbi:AAA family ATPase [Nocardia sp. NPDC003963]